jgi:hypothetical protein
MDAAQKRAVLCAAIIPDQQMWEELGEMVDLYRGTGRQADHGSASQLLGIFLQQFAAPTNRSEGGGE